MSVQRREALFELALLDTPSAAIAASVHAMRLVIIRPLRTDEHISRRMVSQCHRFAAIWYAGDGDASHKLQRVCRVCDSTPKHRGRRESASRSANPGRFFNTSAFATTPQFAIGNASRNPVRGPAYRDLDLALVKHTKLTERTHMELRAEMFDVTNTPAFAQPDGSFGTPAFGSITSTVTDPRVIQFAIR